MNPTSAFRYLLLLTLSGETEIEEQGTSTEDNAEQVSEPNEGSGAQTDEQVAVGNGGTDVGNAEAGVQEQAPDGPATDNPDVTFDQTDDPSTIDEPDPFDQEDTSGVLIPPVAPGSDLERVVRGLTRQAANTLLDLNRRISQGETLSAQQEQCLGAFEEGFGEPLLAVNCDQPLATGDVELWVGEAAFFNTATCRQSLSSQLSDGCVLERLTLTIRTQFIPPANGNGPPRLAFPGALLAYGIDEPTLTLQNIDSALTGVFSCSVSLESAAITGNSALPDCNQRIESIANEIERLQNVSIGD